MSFKIRLKSTIKAPMWNCWRSRRISRLCSQLSRESLSHKSSRNGHFGDWRMISWCTRRYLCNRKPMLFWNWRKRRRILKLYSTRDSQSNTIKSLIFIRMRSRGHKKRKMLQKKRICWGHLAYWKKNNSNWLSRTIKCFFHYSINFKGKTTLTWSKRSTRYSIWI